MKRKDCRRQKFVSPSQKNDHLSSNGYNNNIIISIAFPGTKPDQSRQDRGIILVDLFAFLFLFFFFLGFTYRRLPCAVALAIDAGSAALPAAPEYHDTWRPSGPI